MLGFDFKFDFYEIVVWVATLLLCLMIILFKNLPLKARGGIGQPLPNPFPIIIAIVFFVLFTGYRKNVGDTFYYAHSFSLMGENNPVNAQLFFGKMFSFFQNLIRNKTDDPQALIMFSSIFAMPVPLIILWKYCHPLEMGLYLFVAIGYVGGMMNGMRQYMAAAIVLLGTKYLFSLKKGSFIKYAIIIFLAYCMHNSALMMIVIYIVVRRKAWTGMSYSLIIASIVIVLIFDAILPTFLDTLKSTEYSNYSENGWFTNGDEKGSSILRPVFAAFPVVIAYMNKDRMRRLGHIGDVLINIAFVNIAIYTVALYNWIFSRLAIYLMIYYIILVAWVVNYAVEPREKAVYNIGCVVAFFLYSRPISYQIATYESDYFLPGRTLFGGGKS